MLKNMVVRDLYQTVIGTVCRVTGINENDMLNSNKEDCADARWLLVQFLAAYLTDSEIADLVGRTRQGVNSIKNTRKLSKWTVAVNWKEISKELASNAFLSK